MKKTLALLFIVSLIMSGIATPVFCDCPMSKSMKKQTAQAHGCCPQEKEEACPHHMSADSQANEQAVEASASKPIKTACSAHSKSSPKGESDEQKSASFSPKSELRLSKQRTYLQNSSFLI
jgi:type IV secretory pathway VirB10-like protein